MASLTWLGHAAFLLESDEGKKIYVDPFLTGQPEDARGAQAARARRHHRVTHGHGDHVGDTVALSKAFPEAQIVARSS